MLENSSKIRNQFSEKKEKGKTRKSSIEIRIQVYRYKETTSCLEALYYYKRKKNKKSKQKEKRIDANIRVFRFPLIISIKTVIFNMGNMYTKFNMSIHVRFGSDLKEDYRKIKRR